MTGSPGAEYLVADLDDWAAGHLTYIGTKYRVRWLDMLLLQMSAAMWASLTRESRPATRPQRGMNRPGVSGDFEPWEGWSHVREHVEEVSG